MAISEVAFDRGGGPVVIANAGELLTGKAVVQRWTCTSWCSQGGSPVAIGDTAQQRTCCNGTNGYCPSCNRSYAYGVTRTEGCYGGNMFDIATYPGTAFVVTFSVRAPSTPGSYPLARTEQLDFQCNLDAGGLAGDDARIIVR